MCFIMQIIYVLFLIFPLFLINTAHAEQILTTLSIGTDEIVFDGKWTHRTEWKSTTLTEMQYDDGQKLVIRIGHDYQNLYVLLDFITDVSIQSHSDKAIICVVNKEILEIKPNQNTFCFITVIGLKNSHTLQGGSDLGATGFWKKINNHPQLIAVGGISDENDRYSKIPHSSYEFQIPLELIGRSSSYGFYVDVIDGKTGKEYSWPENVSSEKYPFIPTPDRWGELFSPDKSIPEFNIPIYILLVTFTLVILLGKNTKFKIP